MRLQRTRYERRTASRSLSSTLLSSFSWGSLLKQSSKKKVDLIMMGLLANLGFITPRSEGTAFDLPAIGTSTGVLISPASREGKADDNSLALHTGHNRNKEYLMVKFKATRAVNVAGYASELGAHCGGIDVWMYKGSTLVASKNGLNSDTPFTFPATTLAAGSTLTISVGPNGNFGCDHSSLSLTIN